MTDQELGAVTGHVLDVAWLCFGCGHRIPAGETVHPHGEAWRCTACLPPATPQQHDRRKKRLAYDAARNAKQHPPVDVTGLPGTARQTTRRTRKAKATTLEELLAEW